MGMCEDRLLQCTPSVVVIPSSREIDSEWTPCEDAMQSSIHLSWDRAEGMLFLWAEGMGYPSNPICPLCSVLKGPQVINMEVSCVGQSCPHSWSSLSHGWKSRVTLGIRNSKVGDEVLALDR